MFACSMLMVFLFQSAGVAQSAATPAASAVVQSSAGDDEGVPAPDPQQSESVQNESRLPPVPATTGAPGVFTVETGDVLSKGVFTVSAYTNRFSRAPGSVTFLGAGVNAAMGLTKKIMVFAQFEPYEYVHVGEPSQLSLRIPANQCVHDVFKAPIYCAAGPGPLHNSWHGPVAAYVTDFPYAAYNTDDYGPAVVGAKMNFWSETRGDPLSVSLKATFFIPTESAATELAKFGTQSGAFNYSFSLGLSKTLSQGIVLANNVTYLVTRNPKIGNETLYTPGDLMIFGQGFIFRAQHRLQFLTEYTLQFEQEGHAFGVVGIETENKSLGPSDPFDGVWGARWFVTDTIAIDAGYRYMLNLHQVNDRNGFTISVSKVFGWRK